MEKVRYEEMLPYEIVPRRRRFPAAFVPLGVLEWHSEHLAVGNDALKVQKLCELAAGASGGFAMPTLWYGEPRTHRLMEANHDPDGAIAERMDLPKGNFSARHFGIPAARQVAFYQQVVFHALVQMNTLGFRAVCLVAGHYPLARPAEKACRRFRRIKRFRQTQVHSGIEIDYALPADRARVGGDHAGTWETSMLWYLRPDCVDLSVYRGRDDEQLVGIMGTDPRSTASIAAGRQACEAIVRGLVAKAGELLGKRPRRR
jgi:creatinine amidohydrolase